MYKAKVLVVGPAESGKTVISSVLSESAEQFLGEYTPTQGCRIIEFEVSDVVVGGKKVKAEIELWDCSGDRKFESCWPAMAKDSSGIVLVFDPDKSSHIKELDSWYNYYIDQQQLRDSQCILLAHSRQGTSSGRTPKLSEPLGKITCVSTSLEDDGDHLKRVFNTFLGHLFTTLSESREQDEMNIIDNRW